MDIQSGGHGSQTKLQFNEGWFHTFMYLVVQKKISLVLVNCTKLIFKSYLPKIVTQIRFQVKTKWLYKLKKIFKFGEMIAQCR